MPLQVSLLPSAVRSKPSTWGEQGNNIPYYLLISILGEHYTPYHSTYNRIKLNSCL